VGREIIAPLWAQCIKKKSALRASLLLALLIVPLFAVAQDPLLMGVFPRRSATSTSQLFSPLAKHLETQLGRPVQLVTAKDFPTFWKGVIEKRYDIVHYNQYHYIQSAADYQVIACNVEMGQDTIAGSIYVRSDSGITSIEQLRGRSIIFGGSTKAMMSYIVPQYLLMKGGLKPNDYATSFAKNPPNALLAVYFRQADAGGAGDVVKQLPSVTKITGDDELTYLATSEPIKHLPWAVRRDMPATLQQQIQKSLIQLGETQHGRTILKTALLDGFKKANDNDYDSTRAIIRELPPQK
jgi:phosphonate transport system substrate-binding protein